MFQTAGVPCAPQAWSHLPLEHTPGLGMLFSLFYRGGIRLRECNSPKVTQPGSGAGAVTSPPPPPMQGLGAPWASSDLQGVISRLSLLVTPGKMPPHPRSVWATPTPGTRPTPAPVSALWGQDSFQPQNPALRGPLSPERSPPVLNGFPLWSVPSPHETKLRREGRGLLARIPHAPRTAHAARLPTGVTTDCSICGFILLWAPSQPVSQQLS